MTDTQQNGGIVNVPEEDTKKDSLYGAQEPQRGRVENLTAMGKGRVKGQQNRLTKTMKEAIEQAFDKAGGVDYLVSLAHGTASDRQAFVALVGRLLPMQVNSNIDQKIRVELGWLNGRTIGKTQASDTESLAHVGKTLGNQQVIDGELVGNSAGRQLVDTAREDSSHD